MFSRCSISHRTLHLQRTVLFRGMVLRDRIQDAIENGQRNLHVLQLFHNWCRHVQARKQGVGLVEQELSRLADRAHVA